MWQQLCRGYFIGNLACQLAADTKIVNILKAMLHGLRFDSLWATCWLFISLMFITLPNLVVDLSGNAQKYRRYLGGCFVFTTTVIYIVSIEYFREYKDLFNQFLFGWFYDDKIAILKTIYAEHHVIPNFMLLASIMLFYVKYLRYLICNHPIKTLTTQRKLAITPVRVIYRVLTTIAIIGFYIVGFRGSIGPRPIQLKDAGVTTDPFLNKAIISPYSSLKYAIDDYQENKRLIDNDTNLAPQDIQTLAQKFFNTDQEYRFLPAYMKKTAAGTKFTRPKHIFLIVGESLDAWPLQDQYRKFALTPNLSQLMATGIYFKYFLPCAHTTISALNTIITGIPDIEIHTNYQKSARFPYFTALATQLKKLGFKPQFFYGGYLSWQGLEDFAKAQGFSAVYGAAHISNWQQTNEWGVDDKTLFHFILDNTKAAACPTFNIIMTTSNHPPFSINLEREGFHKKAVMSLLQQPNQYVNAKELGHIWYADKTIGEFINDMIAIDSSSLFVITGDHFGRKHIIQNPSLFESAAVPLIIYSDNIKKYCQTHRCQMSNIAGGHLDIGATLIELVASKGFAYYAMGDNLLAKRKFNLGLGASSIITPNFIAAANAADIMYFTKFTSVRSQKQIAPQVLNMLKGRFEQAMHLARYLVRKGDRIYAAK